MCLSPTWTASGVHSCRRLVGTSHANLPLHHLSTSRSTCANRQLPSPTTFRPLPSRRASQRFNFIFVYPSIRPCVSLSVDHLAFIIWRSILHGQVARGIVPFAAALGIYMYLIKSSYRCLRGLLLEHPSLCNQMISTFHCSLHTHSASTDRCPFHEKQTL